MALPSSFPSSWWIGFLLLFKNPPDTRARNLSGAVGLAAGDSGTSCVSLLLSPNSFSPLGMILASGPAGAVKNSCEAPCFAVAELHTTARWGGSLPPMGFLGLLPPAPAPLGSGSTSTALCLPESGSCLPPSWGPVLMCPRLARSGLWQQPFAHTKPCLEVETACPRLLGVENLVCVPCWCFVLSGCRELPWISSALRVVPPGPRACALGDLKPG